MLNFVNQMHTAKSMKFYTPQNFICVQYSQLTAQSNIVNTSNFMYGGLSMVYYKV